MARTAPRLAYRVFGRLPLSLKGFINRRANTRFLVGVIGVVKNRDGDVLVLRHTYRPGFPWGLPSGWLKEGESVEASLEREIGEETGYAVSFRRLLRVGAGESSERLDVWLEYELAGGTFRPSAEISEARWCPAAALPPLPLGQRRLLEELGLARSST